MARIAISIVEPTKEPRVIELEGERFSIGRGDEVDVRLTNPWASRNHLELVAVGGRLTLRNISPNGTWVNGTSTFKEAALRPGDEIMAGTALLRVQLDPS